MMNIFLQVFHVFSLMILGLQVVHMTRQYECGILGVGTVMLC